MSKKPTKLIGLNFSKFKSMIRAGEEIHLQTARLIPFYKPGDEMALTSIFLSALRLIKEFRKNISHAIGLTSSGYIHIFTEIEFLLFDKKRIDGLILIVRGKKIVDAVLIEVKNKNNVIDEKQIINYAMISKEYGIKRLLTISNQFVSFPTQSPVNVKTPKSVSLYHLSWSYILTIAYILLIDNNDNIADEDQIEIMKEVVNYLESPKSGVVGFTQMKQGWTDVVHKMNAGASLKQNDDSVDETISSWLEEERDMALILSRELGLLVRSGQNRFKKDLSARIKHEKKQLIKNKSLESILQIEGTASNIYVKPNFGRKNIEMSVTLVAPQDRQIRPQITWLRNQIKYCNRKDSELFSSIEKELMVDINIKFTSKPIRIPLAELEYAYEKLGTKEIKSFSILQIKYLGRKFESRKMFVNIIENMLIQYYQCIVQYLKKWEKPVPKFAVKDTETQNI
jgi:archaellin